MLRNGFKGSSPFPNHHVYSRESYPGGYFFRVVKIFQSFQIIINGRGRRSESMHRISYPFYNGKMGRKRSMQDTMYVCIYISSTNLPLIVGKEQTTQESIQDLQGWLGPTACIYFLKYNTYSSLSLQCVYSFRMRRVFSTCFVYRYSTAFGSACHLCMHMQRFR